MIRHPVALATGVLALLAWAPLPFGSVTPWGTALLELGVFLLLGFAAVFSKPAELPPAAKHAALALLAVATIGLLQSVAWPTRLVGLLSPERARLARETATMLGAKDSWSTAFSLAPGISRQIALVWTMVAASFLAGALLGRSKRARRAMVVAFGASVLFQLGFGYQQWQEGRTFLWGVELPYQRAGLRGSFVNPNHTGTYLAIAFAVAFAVLWWVSRRSAGSRKERFGRLPRTVAPLLFWVLCGGGLLLTGSRGALLGALIGLGVQVALLAGPGERRRVLWIGATALPLAAALVVATGIRSTLDRSQNFEEGRQIRIEAMGDTARLVARFPFTGVGVGAFRAAFPLVHQSDPVEGTWWHAHNDWLELAATAGVVGFVIVLAGVVALGRGLMRSWRQGERSEDRAAALAAIGAAVAVGIQELLDFGLTIPANSVTLAFLCGAALAVPLAPKAESATADAGATEFVPEKERTETSEAESEPAAEAAAG